MRFQKAIKRIIALGTGAVMLSGSVFGAVDLANYPAPFVKDGKFSGVIVVGDKAAAEDVIGISDIISSLQFAATKKAVVTTPGAVTVEGDAWQAKTSTKKLELGEDLAVGGIHRELLSNITSFIQKGDLKALDSGQVSNSKATSPYNQYLYLLGGPAERNMDSGYVLYTEDDDTDILADYLYFKSGREIGRYLLEFTTALESDVDDSSGSASTTGLFLTDMQDVDITMFGKKYTIVTAKRTTTGGGNVVLTLMGGAGKDTLLEKQTKTYTISGNDYEVTLNFVDTDEAQFTINGQTTRKLKDGDTDKLSDGTTVGVTDILYQDYAGGIHSATFFIGAQKVELKDTNVTDVVSTNALKVDDNTIDDALVTIEGSDDSNTFRINRVHINMSADDNYFVPAGGKLSAAIKAAGGTTAEPEVLFTSNWDIEYRGLSTADIEKVKITTSGSSEYRLEFQDGGGNKVALSIAKTPSGSDIRFGEQDGSRALINKENRTISKDDYIVLSDSGSSRKRGERPTYVLQYKGADKVTNDNPLLKFKDLGSGKTLEQTYSTASSLTVVGPNQTQGGELATLKVGGSDFKIFNDTSIRDNDFRILVDLDASGAIASTRNGTIGGGNNTFVTAPIVITTKNGMEINVTNETGTQGQPGDDTSDIVYVTFRIPDESRDGAARDSTETLAATVMRFNITASSAEVRLIQDTTRETKRFAFRTPSGKTNIAYGYDSYGSFWTYETPTSAPQLLTIEVPNKQREALVYITAKGASFSEVGATTSEAVTLQRIQVGAAKLASEVSDVKAQNAILVGGPCANAAAATVMGNPADCTAGFEPGVGKVELWEHTNGNVAMLVAGYSALDTRNAAQVVANYADYKGQLKGMKVEVKKVNNVLTVAAPAAKTA
ncbi:hypothetical protein HYX02_03150 [Candidatus Woesearchaeota archaeon]|nr:hypothetical protein [Candidatus Woesearchaeota archaeon]